MTQRDLGGPILKQVSRSFYLSIRVLPAGLRAPIGLAYLLARTSDTIADSAAASPAVRLEHLAAFEGMVQEGRRADLARLEQDLVAGCTPAEQTLLRQIGPCLRWLESLPPPMQQEIRTVLRRIIHGQRLDLQRFAEAGAGRIVALATGAELEEYTYLVAGCVGEFWTQVCEQQLPGWRERPLEEMLRLGRSFGQGLQMVNILRDLPADLRQGRCYLPEAELAAEGLTPAELRDGPARARPVGARWLARGRAWLQEGEAYVRAVRARRVRLACELPWSLGEQTLGLLERSPALERAERVRVTRGAVYRTLVRALGHALLRLPPTGGGSGQIP